MPSKTYFIDFFMGYAADADCLPRKTHNLFWEDSRMKKSHIAVIFVSMMIAGLAGFTGCNNNETPESVPDSGNSVSAPESTVGNSDNSDNSDNSESALESTDLGTPAAPKHELSEEAQKLLSEVRKQSFVGPDGETVHAADAADIYTGDRGQLYDDELLPEPNDIFKDEDWIDTLLKYDFAYIGYVKPYCNFVIEEAGVEPDYSEVLAWGDELEALQDDREWFKVKAGDTLANGLTVIKAECEVLPTLKTDYYSMKLQLDGEFTMEGILTFTPKGDYLLVDGEGIFNPDAVNTSGVPLLYNGSADNRGYYTVSAYTGGYVACDGQGMRIGLIDDRNIDKQEIFGDNNYAHVRITFKDPEFHTDNRTEQMQAAFIELDGEIVDIERVD